jgi:lipoprotein-anchoring transpeptidase ErfK/SrfK
MPNSSRKPARPSSRKPAGMRPTIPPGMARSVAAPPQPRQPQVGPPQARPPQARPPGRPYHGQPSQNRPHPVPAQASPQQRTAERKARTRRRPAYRSFVLLAAFTMLLTGMCLISLLAGVGLVYGSGRILPGVSVAGVSVGNMSEDQAAAALAKAWAENGLVLRDGNRSWQVSPAELGVSVDAEASAAAAREWGRSEGGFSGALESLINGTSIDPVLVVDLAQFNTYLETARAKIDIPATNAGVTLVNGQAVATPASEGRQVNVAATVERMRIDATGELADAAIDLVMTNTYPAITDSSGLVAQANALLSSAFIVNVYDPITDEWMRWSASPEDWAGWLEAASAPENLTGLSLTMTAAGPRNFLEANATFPDERYIEIDDTVAAMQEAINRNETSVTARVWHHPTTYSVGPGQTLAAIAEDVGIPYPYIQVENPGINSDALSVGQQLQLPSRDILVPLEPVPQKRIIISRGQQHLWAYENGQVVFDWVISTGISSSPTALGVFQVQSHELNAYADQWDLYMPHFVGFYHPGPNMDLMNGFHGFPTRSGGYLLWTNNLGRPATYGCVLLSLENAERLYQWAQEGVIVEVRG